MKDLRTKSQEPRQGQETSLPAGRQVTRDKQEKLWCKYY